MAGALKKTMVYLGFVDAEPHQEESFGGGQAQHGSMPAEPAAQPSAPRQHAEQQRFPVTEQPTGAVVSLADRETEGYSSAGQYRQGNLAVDPEYRAPVTPIQRAPSSREESSVMRKITTVHPRSYNDAKLIGEAFREDIPVIMNVTEMGETEAKRLVDFAAGLVFGLGGAIERVTNKVFLLSPKNVEVIAEEPPVEEPATGAKFFNQS